MATQYSTIAKKQLGANGAERPEVSDAYGRVRMVACDGVLDTADTDVVLYHFPAGRVRLLAALGGASDTYKHGGYTKMDGTTQASAALTDLNTKNAGVVIESISGFDLIVTLNTTPTAGTTKLDHLVTFVID